MALWQLFCETAALHKTTTLTTMVSLNEIAVVSAVVASAVVARGLFRYQRDIHLMTCLQVYLKSDTF